MLSAAGTLTCKPDVRSRYSPEANGQAPEIHRRIGNQELYGLRPIDTDLDANRLTVNQVLSKPCRKKGEQVSGFIFGPPKTDKSRRTIDFPEFMRDLLIEHRRRPTESRALWKTRESLRSVRNVGNAALPPTPDGDFTEYVLDGQQRLTSLFAAIKGPKIERETSVDDFADIWIDLSASDDATVVVLDPEQRDPKDLIRVVDLVNDSSKSLFKYAEKHHERLSDLKARISAYTFSTILLKEAAIDVATEIFTRINVTARPLSVFEIMVAKTFDANSNFDLAEEYDNLVTRLSEVNRP